MCVCGADEPAAWLGLALFHITHSTSTKTTEFLTTNSSRRKRPSIPGGAQTRGIEGYVLLEYTVTKDGKVENPRVIEAKPPGIFDRAAFNAVLSWRYLPRIENLEPRNMNRVRNVVTFNLAPASGEQNAKQEHGDESRKERDSAGDYAG
ncbi:MAG: energy transducer TonB [Gammaproteobacteria bacterium]|nr:energy transducer TonB [Gammaproteobacteria bacterium]